MRVNEYKEIRQAGIKLAHVILKSDDSKKNMLYAAELLGFWNGKAMEFEDEDESDVLMNFLLYEKNKKGNKLIDQFYDSEVELDDLEEEILEGMVNSHASLFEVKRFEFPLIILIDLLNKDKEYVLIDLGFSQTGEVGGILYSRLIPIRDIYMTSGVTFAFEPLYKEQVLNDISFAKFKSNRKLNSTDLYLLTYKKSKHYGKKVIRRNV